MRFVSKSANFNAGNLRNAKEAIGTPETRVVDGKTVSTLVEAYVVTSALPIQFTQSGLLQSDIDAGLNHWKTFPGLPLEEDGVTPANPVECGRIGVWDSVSWQAEHSLTDEDREQSEQMLLTSAHYGIEFIQIQEVKAAKPWPSYDDTHHNKIAALASELGLVAETLAYEQEREKPRPSVIEQLEAALPTESGEFVAA
jgi:hypothetical protein